MSTSCVNPHAYFHILKPVDTRLVYEVNNVIAVGKKERGLVYAKAEERHEPALSTIIMEWNKSCRYVV